MVNLRPSFFLAKISYAIMKHKGEKNMKFKKKPFSLEKQLGYTTSGLVGVGTKLWLNKVLPKVIPYIIKNTKVADAVSLFWEYFISVMVSEVVLANRLGFGPVVDYIESKRKKPEFADMVEELKYIFENSMNDEQFIQKIKEAGYID